MGDCGTGNDPWSLFELMSRNSKPDRGRTIRVWLELVRKLWERSKKIRFCVHVFQNHWGIWPRILLKAKSKEPNLSWFCKKFGNSLRLHEANPKIMNFWRVALEFLGGSNDNLFNDTHNAVKFLSLSSMSSSTVPLKLLEKRSRYSRFSSWEIELEMAPLNLFNEKSRWTNLVRLKTQNGMWLVKSLELKSKPVSWVKLARDGGISLKLFLERRKWIILLSWLSHDKLPLLML